MRHLIMIYGYAYAFFWAYITGSPGFSSVDRDVPSLCSTRPDLHRYMTAHLESTLRAARSFGILIDQS